MNFDEVVSQYTQDHQLQRILSALESAGKNMDRLTVQDLAPVDQFHTLGMKATLDLAAAAEIGPNDEVLDAGSGLGGPARTLAARFGCRVTGVDLNVKFCEVAVALNIKVGLQDRIAIQMANALALPFQDGSFDVVWTQHVSMNIEDKAGLFAQFARVLNPAGRLAIFDVIAGVGKPCFPQPWADDPSISHLVDEASLRSLLTGAGFRPVIWEDVTQAGVAFLGTLVPSPLGPQVFMPNAPAKIGNLRKGLESGPLRLIRTVCLQC